jgi:SAM-dependent methyltransferase
MTIRRPLLTAEEIWRKYDAAEERLTAPVSERMLDLAELRPGMRVLDLATGRGEPAIRAAHRVGPTGSVVGVDLSEGLLRMARERAAREGLSNLDLRAVSAESLDGVPTAHFHATLARWGLMYLDSPVAALSAARRAMIPGGVLVAAVWAEPERVPYFTLPRRVLARYVALPPIDPEAPGTFHYADVGRIHRDFTAAGFTVEHVEERASDVMEAETGAELVAWARAFGLTRLLNDLPEEIQEAWETDLVIEAEPLRRDGVVRLGGVTRIVVASCAVALLHPPSESTS